MTKKIKSTYGKLMESMSAKEKKEYEKDLKDFIISELILAAMEEDNISVRKLARLADITYYCSGNEKWRKKESQY